MSSTLDASLDDLAAGAEAEARVLLRCDERRAMAAHLRRLAHDLRAAADRNEDRAFDMDPQPLPFDDIRLHDMVLVHDCLWVEVIAKECRHDFDGRTETLVVHEPGKLEGHRVHLTDGERLPVRRGGF